MGCGQRNSRSMMRHLDLFSGIGGFSLGFSRAGIKTVAFCENDPDAVSVLASRWPHVPVYGDVRSLTVEPGFCDIVSGGFPCQPFSTAARGRNNARDLWPSFQRIIAEAYPRWVVAENVPGIGPDGVDRVARDIEREGYHVWPLDLDTSPPGRSRGRRRYFWLAHADSESESRRPVDGEVAGLRALSPDCWPNHSPPLGVDDGLPGRMDRLRMLGNAVTPYAAEIIGRAIMRVTVTVPAVQEGK